MSAAANGPLPLGRLHPKPAPPTARTGPASRSPRPRGLAVRLGGLGTGGQATRGMTLPELMVAVAVGFLILGVLAQVFASSALSFARMGNYVSLDSRSRNALDELTRSIRQAGDLLEFSPTHLKFSLLGQTNALLVYDYDPAARQLTQWKTGDASPTLLLSECDQLAFSLRNSLFAPTTTLSAGKGISITWTCSRTILGNKTTTEDMEQALIIMRNKPL